MDFNKSIKSIPDDFVIAIFPEEGISVTGSDLRRYSGICASSLQKNGHKRIGIKMGNSPEFLYLLSGALRAGVKVTIINVFEDFKADYPTFNRESAAEIINSADDTPSFQEYSWGTEEPMIAINTSGTGGEKKLVEKCIWNFLGGNGINPFLRLILRAFGIRVYNCSPWYHNTGIALLLLSLAGVLVTQITAERYKPERMRQNINTILPNAIITTPTMLLRSVKCGKMALLAYIICTGEPLSETTINCLEENGGGQLLYNAYGTTETATISHLVYLFESATLSSKAIATILHITGFGGPVFNKQTSKPFCVGSLAKKVEVKIIKDGKEAKDGIPGQIHVRTKTMIDQWKDGFLNTGDLGFYKEGLLYICGRSLNVINRGGEKIIPADIKRVIENMENVKSCVVFGIPSETHGEDICAAIESDNGAEVVKASDFEHSLPKHMIPQHFLFLDSFPVTESGKVNLSILKSLAETRLSQS